MVVKYLKDRIKSNCISGPAQLPQGGFKKAWRHGNRVRSAGLQPALGVLEVQSRLQTGAPAFLNPPCLLPGQCILELKFHQTLPTLFKHLIQEWALKPQPVSKYRLSVETCGLVPLPSQSSTNHDGQVTDAQLNA